MAIVVGVNSFISEEDADTYFSSRLGASEYWTSGMTTKEAALVTAYNQLNSLPFSFPTTIAQAMKDAQCEQALFLLMDTDLDKRAALQAQGVVAAGVVKETYKDKKYAIPLSPVAEALLDPYKEESAFFMGFIARDETENESFTYPARS